MKIAYSLSGATGNNITSVTATSEDADYPASNLLDSKPGKLFKADASNTTTITAVIPAGANACCFVGYTNAESVTITVKDTGETTTYSTGTYDLTPASPARTWNRCWHEWTSNGFALHVIVELTAAVGVVVEAGVLVVCDTVSITDPKYGLGQGRKNNDTVMELAGKGYYVIPGSRPRQFDLQWLLLRETEFDDLDSIFESNGAQPLAMLLSDGLNNDLKWCGFFHLLEGPRASHDHPAYSIVSQSITEAA